MIGHRFGFYLMISIPSLGLRHIRPFPQKVPGVFGRIPGEVRGGGSGPVPGQMLGSAPRHGNGVMNGMAHFWLIDL